MSVFSTACRIVQKLYEEGFTAYFAGGWVRDFLMNHSSNDIDIATSASTDDIQRLFPKTIPVGVNFGIIIIVENDHQFEVATFRKDIGYKDGRRPTSIEPSTPEKDALRRDFTINGMFYDPTAQTIFDYVEGQKDIKEGIIRAIGNPHERFLEDRLRMIRAVRYASRFHFSIEEETLKAIIDHAHLLFPAVAIERVWHELVKMAAATHFDKALLTLHRLNLLPVIFPALKNIPIEKIEKWLKNLPYFPEDAPTIAKILELFPDASYEEKINLCAHFKLSNEDLAFVKFYHKTKLMLVSKQEYELYEWAHLYANPHFHLCLIIIATHFPLEERQSFLQEHHMRQNLLKNAIDRIQQKDPVLKSQHLLELGIPPGKRMGDLLKAGEKIAINEALDDPRATIESLKKSGFYP